MVGHDIRNPLQAIFSELFFAKQIMGEAKDKDTSEALESIKLIQEQVDYISKIVSDLQDYARPLRPDYSDIDLPNLINKIFETIAVPNNVKLKVDVPGLLRIESDPTFIKRALTNLANNSVQAMPNGGELLLSAYKKGKIVVITVADTGKRISADLKPHIFKPLVSNKSKDQGLRLAVVKRLVEVLNGKVNFESEEGKGTQFIIELPAKQRSNGYNYGL